MYKLVKASNLIGGLDYILRMSDNAFIPHDPANADYAEYLKWLAEGNEPLPADAQPE